MRDPNSDAVSSLEVHLHRLKKLEKRQRKQRWAFVILAMVSLVAWGGLWLQKPKEIVSASSYSIISADRQEKEEVINLLKMDKSAVVLVDYKQELRDTLYTVKEYAKWLGEK